MISIKISLYFRQYVKCQIIAPFTLVCKYVSGSVLAIRAVIWTYTKLSGGTIESILCVNCTIYGNMFMLPFIMYRHVVPPNQSVECSGDMTLVDSGQHLLWQLQLIQPPLSLMNCVLTILHSPMLKKFEFDLMYVCCQTLSVSHERLFSTGTPHIFYILY